MDPTDKLRIEIIDGDILMPSCWRIEDVRYSRRWRVLDTLTASHIADLAAAGVRHLVANAGVSAQVLAAYEQLREQIDDAELPELEVVAAEPKEPTPAWSEFPRVMLRAVAGDAILDPERQHGIANLTEKESAAAIRAVEAMQDDKLVVILDRKWLRAAASTDGAESFSAFTEMLAAGNEALTWEDDYVVDAEVVDDDENAHGEHPAIDVIADFAYFVGGPGVGFSFRYCPWYPPHAWSADYRSTRQGTPTTAMIADMLNGGAQHFGFGRDNVKTAMIVAMAMGKAPPRNVDDWFREVLDECERRQVGR